MGQVCSVCRFWDVVPLTDLNQIRTITVIVFGGARHIIPALFVRDLDDDGHQLIRDASDKAN